MGDLMLVLWILHCDTVLRELKTRGKIPVSPESFPRLKAM